MIWAYLRRGLAAGLAAGLLAGLFAFFAGEPSLERAVEIEEQAHAGEHAHEDEPFGRDAQRGGLVLGAALYGTSVGGVFGLVSAFLRGRVSLGSEWSRSLALAGSLFAGAVLFPFVKYPPNPPGVGPDPEALGTQTAAYLGAAGLSLLAVLFAWRVARGLRDAAAPVRHLTVGGFVVASFAALYVLLPGFTTLGEVPADLLWEFRFLSLGTQAVMWGAIAVGFGLLCERAARRERA